MKPLLLLFILVTAMTALSQTGTITLELKSISFPLLKDKEVENWDVSQEGFGLLNKEAKEFYYWTNYSRINPIRFWDSAVMPVLNAYPQLKGSYSESLKKDLFTQNNLQMFTLNLKLLQTAQSHAEDIGQISGKPGHISTDGQTFAERFKKAGLTGCGGENISFGNPEIPFLLVLLYLDYNLSDLGHRKSLLNPRFTEIGIGASLLKGNQIFLVQDFACNQNP